MKYRVVQDIHVDDTSFFRPQFRRFGVWWNFTTCNEGGGTTILGSDTYEGAVKMIENHRSRAEYVMGRIVHQVPD